MPKKSLKDMIKEKETKLSPKEKKTINELKKDVGKYKKMSNSQIVNELKKIQRSDKGGALNQKNINEFEKILAPMLNDSQKKQLNAIKKQMGFD